MSFRSAVSLLPATALFAVAACAKPDAKVTDSAAPAAATASSVAPLEVNVVTTDYAFDAPDTIPSGLVSLRLLNKGKELHHVQLIRLTGGKTYADVQKFLKEAPPGSPPPAWTEAVGGPNSPPPGSPIVQVVTQELTPGAYVMLCFIPSSDGTPHVMKGMSHALTVIPSTGPVATAPEADVRVTMTDYAWDVQGPMTAGKHVIRLENSAAQDHEMFIVRLNEGKTAADFAKWTENQAGPPPATPVGGTAGMPKGVTAYVAVEFTPGEYAMLCFIPDAKDGKPHIAHGMMKQFTVN